LFSKKKSHKFKRKIHEDYQIYNDTENKEYKISDAIGRNYFFSVNVKQQDKQRGLLLFTCT